jgi:ABC-type phosphate/phosphonate transport system ATPase subunit
LEKTYRDCPVFRTLESEEVLSEDNTIDIRKISEYLGFSVPSVQIRRKILLPADLPEFCCLAIIGRSGGGKTTMLRDLAERGLYHFPRNQFDDSKAIVSNFSSKEDAIERLSAVGLKSIPTWVKPRNVLSVGEGFRADMALNIEDYVLLDEFTSTVDRNVARSCCTSLGKYIRRTGKKGVVVCSCHKDFIEYLNPDLVVDIDEMKVYDLRNQDLSRNISIDIYKTSDKDLWKVFKEHHYMSHEINKACHFYVMKLHSTDELVGCFSTLPQMTGTKKWGWRVHRTVVLPDYQGLGISSAIVNFFGEYYHKQGKFLGIRTSSIPMLNSLRHNPLWEVGKPTNSAKIDSRKTHWTELGEKLKGKIRDKDCATARYLGVNHSKPMTTIVVNHPEIQSGEYIEEIEKEVQTLVLNRNVVLSWGKVGNFVENESLHRIIAKYRLMHRFKTTLQGKEIKQLGEIVEM